MSYVKSDNGVFNQPYLHALTFMTYFDKFLFHKRA